MNNFIEIKNLRKVYKLGSEKVVALNNINLGIPAGQFCCILGTSGSGKSTLLNQLAGLEKPTKGSVYINGKNISKMSENDLATFRQNNIGFVFQSYNLMAGMTAIDNVALPLVFKGVGKKKREQAAKKLLIQVGLEDRLNHTPSQMSGGQQQRVGLARAFICSPKLVFADEPTGNLDTKTTKEVLELMLRLSRRHNITIVLVTHDIELAKYADRIVSVVDGKIVDDKLNEPLYSYEPEVQRKKAE